MDSFTTVRDKSRWDWTLMLMVPDWIDPAMFTTAVEQTAAKHHPARLADVRLQTLSEGRCVQTLHVGSFDGEADVLAHLHHEFIPGHRLRPAGTHHEIYLSDFARSHPTSSAPSSDSRSPPTPLRERPAHTEAKRSTISMISPGERELGRHPGLKSVTDGCAPPARANTSRDQAAAPRVRVTARRTTRIDRLRVHGRAEARS
jgi:hypothetical protein